VNCEFHHTVVKPIFQPFPQGSEIRVPPGHQRAASIRRRGGRERAAGAGLMRVIEVWDNREAAWRRGVVANIREQAGRFRQWLVWAGATAPEEVDLQTVQWRWADAAQPVARVCGW
jgi:hypothetical protein